MNSKETLPAYVPAKTKSWPDEKVPSTELEGPEAEELVPSPFGIALHSILATFSLIGLAVGLYCLTRPIHRESEQMLAATFFFSCCCQLLFSTCSFSKAFLSSSNGIVKFFRYGLPCITVANLTFCLAVCAAIGSNLAIGIISFPFIFAVVFLPYFLFISNEKSRLRPYMKA